jgi:DNA-binding YbaB/EbfC family protein
VKQNPMKMMQQMQKVQARIAKVQSQLENERVEASAGGGAITAVVTGQQKLVSIEIDPEVAGDVEMLQDLVVVAVNDAMERSRELAAARMQEVTAGLGLPPGLV